MCDSFPGIWSRARPTFSTIAPLLTVLLRTLSHHRMSFAPDKTCFGGSLHKQDYAIAGSGSTFIYGYCDKYFRKGFTKDEAVAFVKTSLAEAIKWDGSSGGVIRMVILTNQPTERLIFYPDEYQNEYPNA